MNCKRTISAWLPLFISWLHTGEQITNNLTQIPSMKFIAVFLSFIEILKKRAPLKKGPKIMFYISLKYSENSLSVNFNRKKKS